MDPLNAFLAGVSIGRAEVHLERMKQICDETDAELEWLPIDHYECAVCGKVAHCDQMLLPTAKDNGDLVCSEECAAKYKLPG